MLSHAKAQAPIVLGVAAALFFAVTFVINKLMADHGGSWIWSSSLRFYWMLPFFVAIVVRNRNFKELIIAIRKKFWGWMLWSAVGFGLFYAPLTYASSYSESWLLASTWQITIVAGMAVSPLINRRAAVRKPSVRPFLFSGIILAGVFIMQVRHAQTVSATEILHAVLPVMVAAFALPLGNRKMMQLTEGQLDVFQRILGMLICSLPFWLLLSGYEILFGSGLPSKSQYLQTLAVALCSGVVATVLFFKATEMAGTEARLAGVEATQSVEVLFTLAAEILFLNSPFPDVYDVAGIVLVIAGMVLHVLWGSKPKPASINCRSATN